MPADVRGGDIGEQLVDVTGSVDVQYGTTSLAGTDNQLFSDISATNVGRQTFRGQLVMVIDQISDIDAFVFQPDGISPNGLPYIDLTSGLAADVDSDGGVLQPGQSIDNAEARFLQRGENAFTFTPRFFAVLNESPGEFSSTPLSEIEIGRTYRYTATAKDPDGDPLQYSITAGPEAATIDPISGELVWNTTNELAGNYTVTLSATDPFGESVQQTFTIDVVESLQNRPPIFVTDPITDATASSGFEVTTVGVGDSPAGAAIISGFRGPRVVSANGGDQTIGVYAGENNDRFDDPTTISTGFRPADGQLFDVGYSVDVGLRPFRDTFDRNEVLGLDQADINGDGILDLAAMSLNQYSENGTQYELSITTHLGDGNGDF
ncbi:MAG: putative Ig domain-containing protein, partial [Planctomycetota bacterium]